MISLALAGKPNCGKSTFFRAATMAPAEIANYPFTTIDANKGVAFVRSTCACRALGVKCTSCQEGIRYTPVGLIDVAGLVPDAHKGRGLGNQFLDHLRQADAIIHVIDASGGTDSEGNPVDPGTHDPLVDIDFVTREMTMWVHGILEKHWAKITRQAQAKSYSIHHGIAEVFTGLGVTPEAARDAERICGIDLLHASADDLIRFCGTLIRAAKPMFPVGNRVDLAPKDIPGKLKGAVHLFSTAAGELALRNATNGKVIAYRPGDPTFSIFNEGSLSPAQSAGLMKIRAVMDTYGGTGVQQAINHAVFSLLDRIVVYPVEDETHYTNKDGTVLPDAFLVRRGATPHDLAFLVHSDIGKGFLYAIDAKTKMRVKESHLLQDGDVIKIVTTAK
jgi:hypothetical protein